MVDTKMLGILEDKLPCILLNCVAIHTLETWITFLIIIILVLVGLINKPLFCLYPWPKVKLNYLVIEKEVALGSKPFVEDVKIDHTAPEGNALTIKIVFFNTIKKEDFPLWPETG